MPPDNGPPSLVRSLSQQARETWSSLGLKWRGNVSRRSLPNDGSELGLLSPDSNAASASRTSIQSANSTKPLQDGELPPLRIKPAKNVRLPPDANRVAARRLTGMQLFAISLNGTLGTGLYWAGGRALETGGPFAAVAAFLLMGIVAILVMQCITELMCLWPVPGALSAYVSSFVDEELGIACGVAYWFTYSIAFSALMASTAEEIDFWKRNNMIKGWVVFLLLPICLIGVNWLEIKNYGRMEIAVGSFKVAFYCFIAIVMMAIAGGAGHDGTNLKGAKPWNNGGWSSTDEDVSQDKWGLTFLSCLSQAGFAYVGVEITAASALEARWSNSKPVEATITDTEAHLTTARRTPAKVPDSIRRAAQYFPGVVTIAYTFGLFLVSLVVPRDHCNLPRMSFIDSFNCTLDDGTQTFWTGQNSTSAFTVAARMSEIPHLPDVANAMIVFTALFCASTNLYVASRALFSLTSNIEAGNNQRRVLRLLAWVGKTDHRKVPLRAIVISAIAFMWVPPLQLVDPSTSAYKTFGKFTEVLAGMGSVGVVVVWTCNVWAYIRFYHSIDKYHDYDELKKYDEAQRGDDDRYPVKARAHLQPYFGYVALIACLFLLIVANGAVIWGNFQPVIFLTAYLTLFTFLGLWVVLKIVRNGRWELIDLSKPELVAKRIQRLNDTRYRALEKGVKTGGISFRQWLYGWLLGKLKQA